MIGNLHGKRVLVIGASGGLGESLVRFLTADGARVAAAGRRICTGRLRCRRRTPEAGAPGR
jgi:NAD(P)-dependent dehydrogenase (short-subunit alcohol dehydrogenase family)